MNGDLGYAYKLNNTFYTTNHNYNNDIKSKLKLENIEYKSNNNYYSKSNELFNNVNTNEYYNTNFYNSYYETNSTSTMINKFVNNTEIYLSKENKFLKDTVEILNKTLTDLQIRINILEDKFLSIKIKNVNLKNEIFELNREKEAKSILLINLQNHEKLLNYNNHLILENKFLKEKLENNNKFNLQYNNENDRKISFNFLSYEHFSFQLPIIKNEFSIKKYTPENFNKKNENLELENEEIKLNNITNSQSNKEIFDTELEDIKDVKFLRNYIQTNESFKDDEESFRLIEVNEKITRKMDHIKFESKVIRKSKKIEITDGAKYIFRVYDKKSLLKFDIENRSFRVIEFADFGDFSENFNQSGSIYINIFNGLFIVTGMNHDMFYHFNYQTKTMTKLAKLNDNHKFGSMIMYEKENYLICMSGYYNKKVEKYKTEGIVTNFFKNESHNLNKETKFNKWSNLPEMKRERAECPYIIINDDLYTFFGYNYPKCEYVETIEKLNLANPIQWEEIRYKNTHHISTLIKSHSCLKINENQIVFLGGFDGLDETPLDNFFEYYLKEKEFKLIERKYPEIIYNQFYNFQNDPNFVPYVDSKDRLHYIGYDDKERIHSIELNMFLYDIYKYD